MAQRHLFFRALSFILLTESLSDCNQRSLEHARSGVTMREIPKPS
jgi:hypothetical protein